MTDKIKQCIDVANEYRMQKSRALIAEAEKEEIGYDYMAKEYRSMMLSLRQNPNVIKKVIGFVVVSLFAIAISPVLLYFILTRPYYLKKRTNKILAGIKLGYENSATDFQSLWDEKGLTHEGNPYMSKGKYVFKESDRIECIMKWYKIFKGNNFAEVSYHNLLQQRQAFYTNAHQKGIVGIQMEELSYVLIEKLNFVFDLPPRPQK